MNRLAEEIAAAEVSEGSVQLWWLGQAGFAFKAPSAAVVYVDPYLSDAVERLHGFKRLSLAPLAAEDVRADLVVLTHEHADHLDPDAIPVIARNNPSCRFAGPAGCGEGLRQAGVAENRTILLEPRQQRDLDGVTIHAAAADHGDFSPSAVAMVLDFGGVRIMLTGDTSWRSGLFQPLFDLRPDVVLPCINGVFGNMGHIDAAHLVQQANPALRDSVPLLDVCRAGRRRSGRIHLRLQVFLPRSRGPAAAARRGFYGIQVNASVAHSVRSFCGRNVTVHGATVILSAAKDLGRVSARARSFAALRMTGTLPRYERLPEIMWGGSSTASQDRTVGT